MSSGSVSSCVRRLSIGLLFAAAALPVCGRAQTTVTFQQGTAGYASSIDRVLTSAAANSNVAVGEVVMNNGTIGESQYFLKFDNIFGAAAGLIPTNATILSATLTLKVGATAGDNLTATSNGITVAAMLSDFTTATNLISWPGVSATGTTALTNGPLFSNSLARVPTVLSGSTALNTAYSANVTYALQGWLSGAFTNYGFVLQSQSTDNARFNGDAATTVANRPILSVTYVTSANTTSFKTGVNGYNGFGGIVTQHPTAGTLATSIVNAATTKIGVDGATGGNLPGDAASADAISLLKYDNILGSATSQVPTRATISKAWFVVMTSVGSNDQSSGSYKLYRMNTAWTTSSNYDSFGGTTGPLIGTDYQSTGVAPTGSTSLPLGTSSLFDVTADITAWKNGTTNNGWIIRSTGTTDGWSFFGPSQTPLERRPELQVMYTIEQLRWKGNISSVWDAGTAVGTGGTNNWTLETAGTATNFIPTDRVLFDDSAAVSGVLTVSVAADVSPQRTTFSNSLLGYVLTGPGSLVGGGELWKTGTATATIGTNVALTGGTHVFAGTLQVGDGATSGSLAGSILVDAGAVLAINRSDAVAYSAAITGAGGLLKSGAGRAAMGSALALTGAYTVNAGTLAVASTARPASVTLAAGSTFAVTSGVATSTMVVPALVMPAGGANLQFELSTLSNPTVPLLSVTGTDALVLNGGAHALTIASNGSLGMGTFTAISYVGADITSGFTLAPLPQRLLGSLIYNTAAKTIDLSITDQSLIVWSGAVDGNWDAGTGVNLGGTLNWVERAGTPGAAPTNFFGGDKVTFDDTALIRSVNLIGAIAPSGVTVDSKYDFTFGGSGSLAPTLSLTKSGSGRLTLLVSKTSSGLTAVNGGVLQVGDATNSPTVSGQVNVAATANLNVVNGTLAAATTVQAQGGLRVDGGTVSGALTVNGAADFFGGNLSGATTLAAGAVMTVKPAFAGTLTGNITIPTGAVLEISPTAALRYDKVVSGTGTININGTGRVTFGGSSNGFTGTVNVNSGEFRIDDPTNTAGDLGVTSIVVSNGGKFQFGDANIGNPDLPNTTYITVNTGGLVVFQEGEDYGGFHLNGGTVLLDQSGFNAAGTTLQVWNSGFITSGAAPFSIGGTGSAIKLTTGVVEVSGSASINFTGGLQIAEGTLRLLGSVNLGTGVTPISLGSDATAATPTIGRFEYAGGTASRPGAFTVNQGGGVIAVTTAGSVLSLTGTLAGTGALTKLGAGALSLGNATSYSGMVSVQEGDLMLVANSSWLSGNTIRINGGRLTFAAAVNVNALFSVGELQLSPTASVRDVILMDANATPAPAILTLGAKNVDMTYDGTFSGGGGITKVGTGKLSLTQASTHTGLTQVAAGTLSLLNGNALQGSTVDLAGGTLSLDAAVTSKVFVLGGLTSSASSPAGFALVNSNAEAVTLVVGQGGGSSQYAGVLSGAGGLTKVGNGTLTLAGANTFLGELKVLGGTLALAGVSQLAGGVTLDGGVLQVGHALALSNVATLNISGSAGLSWSPGVTVDVSSKLPALPSSTTFGFDTNGNDVALSTGLTGGATVRKSGVGRLALSAQPGFTGQWVLAGGYVGPSTDSAFGAVPSTAVPDAVVLAGGGLQPTVDLRVNVNRGLQLVGGSTGYLNPGVGATLRVDSAITSTANATLVIGSPEAFFNGAGTVVLSANNTFSGSLLVQGGNLQVSGMGDGATPSAFGFVPMTPAGLKFSGGSLIYVGAGETSARGFTVMGSGATFTANGTGPLVISSAALVDFNNDVSPNRQLTLAGSGAGLNVFAAEMFEADPASYVFASFVKEGVGKWLLAGPAARFDPTAEFHINAGELVFADGALGGSGYTGSIRMSGSSTLTWSSGNTNDISARLVVGDGSIATLSVPAAATVQFAHAMGFGQVGDGHIVKSGDGALVLAAANVFSGGVEVKQGLLIANVSAALGSGAVSVVGGTLRVDATLGNAVSVASGTITGNGSVDGLGVASGAVLNPGNGVGTLSARTALLNGGSVFQWEALDASGAAGSGFDRFAVSGALDLTGASPTSRIVLRAVSPTGATAGLRSGQGYALAFATFGSLNLASGQNVADLFTLDFAQFHFADGTLVNPADWSVSSDSSSLLLTNIPEPSTYGLGLGALALALAAVRRRRSLKATDR